jgi:hypothetical protein
LVAQSMAMGLRAVSFEFGAYRLDLAWRYGELWRWPAVMG